ncbi:MAG: serine hydrolase, partial [Nocardiopsaceae bacterium]|nr:serine hydrolase [Nocardiopsaceae bacterium]
SGQPTGGAAAAPASPSSTAATGVRGAGQGVAARSATVPSTAPTAAAPSSASAQASPSSSSAQGSASQAAGPLAGVRSYLDGRRGRTEVAVYDLSTGRQWTVGPQAPQSEGSAVALEILEAVLHERKVQRTVLSLSEQELTPPMIEQGDDAATTAMWRDAGGAKGMRAFDHAARLTRTSPWDCLRCHGSSRPGWGLTLTTPHDLITLLRQLVQPSGMLDHNDQKYALHLLENVTSAQRWGVSYGVPAGVTVALKNGLLPPGDGKSGWHASSAGWVSGDGRNYLMVVLSAGDPSERYGIATLNHLGALAWNALARPRG